MQRRDFLLALAAGTAGCLSACNTTQPTAHSSSPASSPAQASPLTSTSPSPTPTPTPSPTPSLNPLHLQDGPPSLPAPSPADSLITGLPENVGNVLAITIDDGVDSSVVDAYLDFARDSGVRLTFCVQVWFAS